MILFIFFVIIPLTEIGLFVKVGGAIGIFDTLLLCVLTAMIGAVLIRWQGLHTLASARESMARGGLPVNEMFDGICIAAAGALLMTPGFFTDGIGFALLIPPVRDWLRKKAAAHFQVDGTSYESYSRTTREPDVIEAEYEKIDERDGA